MATAATSDSPDPARSKKHLSRKSKAAIVAGVGIPIAVIATPDTAAAQPEQASEIDSASFRAERTPTLESPQNQEVPTSWAGHPELRNTPQNRGFTLAANNTNQPAPTPEPAAHWQDDLELWGQPNTNKNANTETPKPAAAINTQPAAETVTDLDRVAELINNGGTITSEDIGVAALHTVSDTTGEPTFEVFTQKGPDGVPTATVINTKTGESSGPIATENQMIEPQPVTLADSTQGVHKFLTVAGAVPGPFDVLADGADAAIYLAEGKPEFAAMSVVGMFPFIGSLASANKLATLTKTANAATKPGTFSDATQLVAGSTVIAGALYTADTASGPLGLPGRPTNPTPEQTNTTTPTPETDQSANPNLTGPTHPDPNPDPGLAGPPTNQTNQQTNTTTPADQPDPTHNIVNNETTDDDTTDDDSTRDDTTDEEATFRDPLDPFPYTVTNIRDARRKFWTAQRDRRSAVAALKRAAQAEKDARLEVGEYQQPGRKQREAVASLNLEQGKVVVSSIRLSQVEREFAYLRYARAKRMDLGRSRQPSDTPSFAEFPATEEIAEQGERRFNTARGRRDRAYEALVIAEDELAEISLDQKLKALVESRNPDPELVNRLLELRSEQYAQGSRPEGAAQPTGTTTPADQRGPTHRIPHHDTTGPRGPFDPIIPSRNQVRRSWRGLNRAHRELGSAIGELHAANRKTRAAHLEVGVHPKPGGKQIEADRELGLEHEEVVVKGEQLARAMVKNARFEHQLSNAADMVFSRRAAYPPSLANHPGMEEELKEIWDGAAKRAAEAKARRSETFAALVKAKRRLAEVELDQRLQALVESRNPELVRRIQALRSEQYARGWRPQGAAQIPDTSNPATTPIPTTPLDAAEGPAEGAPTVETGGDQPEQSPPSGSMTPDEQQELDRLIRDTAVRTPGSEWAD